SRWQLTDQFLPTRRFGNFVACVGPVLVLLPLVCPVRRGCVMQERRGNVRRALACAVSEPSRPRPRGDPTATKIDRVQLESCNAAWARQPGGIGAGAGPSFPTGLQQLPEDEN